MTLITYKPRTNIVGDIDRWFDNFWNIDCGLDQPLSFNPRCNITENETSYYISLDLPGINKKDVDISISNGMIAVSGERKSDINKDGGDIRSNQVQSREFERSFYVPEDADIDKIDAKMNSGVLSIEIEKIAADIKKISVN